MFNIIMFLRIPYIQYQFSETFPILASARQLDFVIAVISQPSECGRQHTLNIVNAQTAAQQQSNGSYEARMSGKCGEWRD